MAGGFTYPSQYPGYRRAGTGTSTPTPNPAYNPHDDHPGSSRPTGGGNPSGPWRTLAGPQRSTPQGVRQMQQWLNARGAHLIVDGMWGPRTSAAYSSLAKRLKIPFAPPNLKPPGATPPPRRPAPTNTRRPAPTHTPAAAPPGAGAPAPTQAPGLGQVTIGGRNISDIVAQIMKGNSIGNMPNITPQHVDPAVFGAVMAQMQYGPQIAELMRQQGTVQGNLAPTLQNINTSFDRAANTAQQGAAHNQAFAQQMQGQTDNTAQALANSVGNNPAIAAALGAGADVSKGLMAQQALAQSGLDQANQTDTNVQRANATTQAQNSSNANLDNLRQQLLSAISQRALAGASNTVQGMQMNDQFRSNAIGDESQAVNTRLAEALAGPQVTASRLANAGTSSGLLEQLLQDNFNRGMQVHQQGNADTAAQDAHSAAIDAHANAILQRRLATMQAQNANKPAPFYKIVSDPKTAQDLHNLVWSGLVRQNAQGAAQVVVNPNQAYNTIMQRLRSQFPGAQPTRLRNWARGEVNSGIPNHGWQWNGHGYTKLGGRVTVPTN